MSPTSLKDIHLSSVQSSSLHMPLVSGIHWIRIGTKPEMRSKIMFTSVQKRGDTRHFIPLAEQYGQILQAFNSEHFVCSEFNT